MSRANLGQIYLAVPATHYYINPNPPGMHGARRRKKSDYGLTLEEKQKLKAVYGMLSEKQLLRYYQKAVNAKGTTADNLAKYLESRLDVIVYRLKFAPTILQLISWSLTDISL